MPVKWDSEKDKFILNCLLLDPSVNIGTAVIDSICKTWPDEFGDAPTRKAVQEHFFKIRKTNKKFAANRNGTSTPIGTPTKVNKPRATPVKKGNGVKTPTSKRKRNVSTRVSDNSDDDEVMTSSIGEIDGLNGKVENESPTKRARNIVKYEEDDDGNEGAQDSGPDFHAEEA